MSTSYDPHDFDSTQQPQSNTYPESTQQPLLREGDSRRVEVHDTEGMTNERTLPTGASARFDQVSPPSPESSRQPFERAYWSEDQIRWHARGNSIQMGLQYDRVYPAEEDGDLERLEVMEGERNHFQGRRSTERLGLIKNGSWISSTTAKARNRSSSFKFGIVTSSLALMWFTVCFAIFAIWEGILINTSQDCMNDTITASIG
jgi:hypothetical protein